MVSILKKMFMNIYSIYMKMFESMITLCYKDKVKGKLTKVLYACMVHGKRLGFFFFIEGRKE